jgi:hypothetical protein
MPRSILMALVAVLALPAPALARQTLFFDAPATHVHGATARRVVRDAAGRRIGRFSYTRTQG